MSKRKSGPPGEKPAGPRTIMNVPQTLQQAAGAYGRGEWFTAEQLCRLILGARPRNFDALSLLGVIAAQSERPAEAAELLERAVDAQPMNAAAHNNYANVLKALQRYEAATDSYARALQLNPNYAEAAFNRGVTLQELRRFEEALSSYDRALRIKPDYVEACCNRGNVLRELQRFDDALASYERALALRPDFADAHYNRANLLQSLHRPDDALAAYARALELRPMLADGHFHRGNLLRGLGRLEEAVASYGRALESRANHADAYNNRGVALQELMSFDAALADYDRALAVNPEHADACNNRGSVLAQLTRHDEALASYDRALRIWPDYTDAMINRAVALKELGRFAEALQGFERVRWTDPDHDWLYGRWLHTKMQLGDWTDLEPELAELEARLIDGKKAAMPFVVLALCDSPALQRRAAEIWVRESLPREPQPGQIGNWAPHERIRVGYFSGDFRDHPISRLIAEHIESHDRSAFEIVAFSSGPDRRDPLRVRMERAFDRFIDVRNAADGDIVALARKMELDIAVDLGGFTDSARPNVFALRAAPVQVSYLGYLGTMGAQYMDYLIADSTIVPEEARVQYSEKILYLPSYQVNDSRRRASDRIFGRAELGLPADGFVFCCFNAVYKILPACFDGWMRILRRVDGSVLFLIADDETVRRNLRGEAESRGIDPGRLVFGTRLPAAEYLARCRAADLFLDTLPYNAGTTASDALWMGLPVLTRRGESFASRIAASLLTAIGLPELIASTQEHYESLAVDLATDPRRIAGMKARLEMNRTATRLFDTQMFARGIETAFRRILDRSRAGLGPDHIPAP